MNTHGTQYRSVLIFGSGGLKIGQAGEFDYSGSQAIKALKEEGIRVVLMNPNIATVQTDRSFADEVYFLPLTAKYAEEVIKRENPDAVLLGFGGQTALNLGLALEESGVFKKYGVKVLGTPVATIRDTEDRQRFTERLAEIEVKTAKSIATHSLEEAVRAARTIGYPVMVRSGFALGGEGSGVMRNEADLSGKLSDVFKTVSQVLVEECLSGWKEVEYEVVRDAADNCITVCNMENLDPMGVHTGESMVVAPSQTLTNEEYHRLREVAIKTIRHLGIVGECNIQYALNPKNAHDVEYRVIEVNARLSRSSALASKATGYPLAYVAAKLALGYKLPDLKNAITGTSACFEPALDYMVLKIPRWDLNKFEHASHTIGTEMKSVGEVMAIGRSFEEVLQKGLRMLGIGAPGFAPMHFSDVASALKEIQHPTSRRIFALAYALSHGITTKKLHTLSKIDPWFLEKMKTIADFDRQLPRRRLKEKETLNRAKKLGFSDQYLAARMKTTTEKVRAARVKFGIVPVVKQIDTMAGEFPAKTNYLYLTYHGVENDITPSKNAVAVLGGGPYSIGSSVEFDWCNVQALKTIRADKRTSIMINCNPETVSTDYDESDRLYFEELSLERVRDIADFEKPKGVVISMGGQTPNTLALPLAQCGIKVLGTTPKDIDRAENRHIFSKLLDKLDVQQPSWTEVQSVAQAITSAETMGFPVLVRPSYVLSGSAMNVAYDGVSLKEFLKRAADVSYEHPVVVSKFIENAREIEIDGVAEKGLIVIYAITEHVENAGTHSGDATVVIPPQKTYLETMRRVKQTAKAIVKALKITGPFNIQFIAKDNHLMVIECNVRASRSFPFVSKATGHNFAELASRALLGKDISGNYRTVELDYVAVKSPQFSYNRIKGADPVSYVEMASTGEVACFGNSFESALLASVQAAGFRIPKKGIFLSLGKDENKIKLLPAVEKLRDLDYKLFATEGTADFLNNNNIPCEHVVKKVGSATEDALTLVESGAIDLIINIPSRGLERGGNGISSLGFQLRRKAVDRGISLITNRQLAESIINALYELRGKNPEVKSWREYV